MQSTKLLLFSKEKKNGFWILGGSKSSCGAERVSVKCVQLCPSPGTACADLTITTHGEAYCSCPRLHARISNTAVPKGQTLWPLGVQKNDSPGGDCFLTLLSCEEDSGWDSLDHMPIFPLQGALGGQISAS